MLEKTIVLKNFEAVKSFVDIANQKPYDIELVSGKYVVNAKSIMGVFSLDPQGDKSYGYAFGASWQTPMGADYAALHWITVIPEFRGWGVGKAIFDKAVRLASEQKKLSIRADLYEENGPACKLLERFGFVRCGRLTIRNSMGRIKERAAFELLLD